MIAMVLGEMCKAENCGDEDARINLGTFTAATLKNIRGARSTVRADFSSLKRMK